MAETIYIKGPVGRLETLFMSSEVEELKGIAIILHPNPLEGGTNNNKIVQTIAKSLIKVGYDCYLPNLRGVGSSEGQHDYGRGELEDVLAIHEAIQNRYLSNQLLVLSGFSFGGFLCTLLVHKLTVEKLILFAPAVNKYPVKSPFLPSISDILLFQGSDDDIVPMSDILEWTKPQNLSFIVFPGTGHFFHGKLLIIQQWIKQFMK